MNYTPKIVETATKKGQITVARRRYLKRQTAVLEVQQRSLKVETDIDFENLFQSIADIGFNSLLNIRIATYKDELMDLLDIQDQYNS